MLEKSFHSFDIDLRDVSGENITFSICRYFSPGFDVQQNPNIHS